MMDADNYVETVRRAQGGSEAAFEWLVARHYRAALGVAYAAAGDWHAAEDIAQETFIAAWRHREQLMKPERFQAWVMQIARNLARNWLRSESYRRKLRERYAAEPKEAETAIVSDEGRAAVDGALGALSPALRETVTLYYLERKSVSETAEALAISPSAVKKRMERARRTMRGHLLSEYAQTLEERGRRVNGKARAAWIVGLLGLPPAAPAAAQAAALGSLGAAPWAVGAKVAATLLAVAGALAIALVLQNHEGRQTSHAAASPPSETTTQSDPAPDAAAPVVPAASVEANEPAQDAPKPPPPEAPQSDEAPPPTVGVSGHVVDEQGSPVPGATVYLMPRTLVGSGSDEGPRFDKPPSLQLAYQSTTDQDGAFAFQNLPLESYLGGAGAPGYANSHPDHIALHGDPPPDDWRITLESGITQQVRIVDRNYQPVAGAAIVMRGTFMGNPARMAGGIGAIASTDSNGAFALGMEEPGSAALEVRSERLGITVFPQVTVGQRQPVQLQWPESADLHGVIVGAEAMDVQIRLQGLLDIRVTNSAGADAGGIVIDGASYLTETRADGRYSIRSVATFNTYHMIIEDDEGNALTPKLPLEPFAPGETRRFDYTLEALSLIQGTVTGAHTGAPLADIKIDWHSVADPELNGTVQVEDDGTYRLELRVPAGRYMLTPKYTTHTAPDILEAYARPIELPLDGDADVDLTFIEPVTRTVRVVDEVGDPVAGAGLGLYTKSAGWHSIMFPRTDDDGLATYAGVPPFEAFHIRVNADGYLSETTESFAGEPGDVFEEELVVLKAEPAGD